MVEGVDEHGARGAGELGGGTQGLVDGVTPEHDIRPVVLGGLQLGQGNAHGHEDGRLDAELARRVGDALRMVACRGGDDAARLLLVGEQGEPIVGTADLVGAGALKVLALE